jgi:rubrerythrin
MSTKTNQIIRLYEEGETDRTVIKEKTGASEALISRCIKRYEASKAPEPEEQEEEVSDEEIEAAIKQIKIKPEEKYLNKTPEAQEEDYRCMGCNHEWKSKTMPSKCPSCGSEF